MHIVFVKDYRCFMAFTGSCKYSVKCYRQNDYGRGITVLNQLLLEEKKNGFCPLLLHMICNSVMLNSTYEKSTVNFNPPGWFFQNLASQLCCWEREQGLGHSRLWQHVEKMGCLADEGSKPHPKCVHNQICTLTP